MIIKNNVFKCLVMMFLLFLGSVSEAKISAKGAAEFGLATFYSDKYHGRQTASGEIYSKYAFTTVHANYPFGTILQVTNLLNNRSVKVRVNDRAPLHNQHLLDLSLQAATALDFVKLGWAKVKVVPLQIGNT